MERNAEVVMVAHAEVSDAIARRHVADVDGAALLPTGHDPGFEAAVHAS